MTTPRLTLVPQPRPAVPMTPERLTACRWTALVLSGEPREALLTLLATTPEVPVTLDDWLVLTYIQATQHVYTDPTAQTIAVNIAAALMVRAGVERT